MSQPESVDSMLADMEKIERIRVWLEKIFGAPVKMTVGWAGESWEELRRKDLMRRIEEFKKEYTTSGRRYSYRDRR